MEEDRAVIVRWAEVMWLWHISLFASRSNLLDHGRTRISSYLSKSIAAQSAFHFPFSAVPCHLLKCICTDITPDSAFSSVLPSLITLNQPRWVLLSHGCIHQQYLLATMGHPLQHST